MCAFPARPALASYGAYEGTPLVLGLRRVTIQDRLPHGTAHKRLNAAARRGLADNGRYYAARFPDLGAAQLAAALLSHREYTNRAAHGLAMGLVRWMAHRLAAGSSTARSDWRPIAAPATPPSFESSTAATARSCANVMESANRPSI